MSATIKDVARLAGVSISTASIALSGKGPVSRETSERVLQAAKKLRYRPNALARSLATSKSQSVGLILPDIRDPYFHEIADGVEQIAWEQGYTLFLVNTNRSIRKERAAIEAFQSHRVEGVIFAGSGSEGEAEGLIDLLGEIPIVALGRYHQKIPAVRADNVELGKLATEHLINIGRQRIGFIGGPSELTTSVDRAKGFQKALYASGKVMDLAYVVEGDFTPEGGTRAMETLLRRLRADGLQMPDGIFVANDQMALGVLQALRSASIDVPGETAVVGGGDIPTVNYIAPSLTTVALPTQRMGKEAMGLLFRMLAGEKAPEQPIVLPVRLVRRQSA